MQWTIDMVMQKPVPNRLKTGVPMARRLGMRTPS